MQFCCSFTRLWPIPCVSVLYIGSENSQEKRGGERGKCVCSSSGIPDDTMRAISCVGSRVSETMLLSERWRPRRECFLPFVCKSTRRGAEIKWLVDEQISSPTSFYHSRNTRTFEFGWTQDTMRERESHGFFLVRWVKTLKVVRLWALYMEPYRRILHGDWGSLLMRF